MITATTLRRVGQLNAENNQLRDRMAALKAERDYLLRRLADFHQLDLSQFNQPQSNTNKEQPTL